jgi:hypothetical protein
MTRETIHPEHAEFIEQHLHFETLLDHLRDCTKESPAPGVLLDELHHMRERVLRHFALEEKDGYLHAALTYAERLQGMAASLFQEHTVLLQQLDNLIAQVKQASHVSADIVRDVEALIRKFHEHEHRENELVQRAVNEVIGAID